MSYMNTHYFPSENYIKINNKPLLLNFGPITLLNPSQWTTAFSIFEKKPEFLTLWNTMEKTGDNATGEFAWVYKDQTSLANFYAQRAPKIPFAMAGAYPGFHDFYGQSDSEKPIGWTIEHANGKTFDETLSMAKSSGLKHLQLITWNDFGEGTMIEPTQEFGYQYVEKLKNFAGVQDNQNWFKEIGKLFTMRKKYKGNAEIQKKLDQVAANFAAMQAQKALTILSQIQ